MPIINKLNLNYTYEANQSTCQNLKKKKIKKLKKQPWRRIRKLKLNFCIFLTIHCSTSFTLRFLFHVFLCIRNWKECGFQKENNWKTEIQRKEGKQNKQNPFLIFQKIRTFVLETVEEVRWLWKRDLNFDKKNGPMKNISRYRKKHSRVIFLSWEFFLKISCVES